MDENGKSDEELELERLRLKKMQELMQAQKKQQTVNDKVISLTEKLDYVLKVVLQPDAYAHLDKLKKMEPNVYQFIFNELVSQDVIMNIDYLITLISRQGGVRRRIPLDIIIYLERKAKGIRSKIQVKKGNGEMMDLGSYLTK
jgi:DNA-binding TFAR19-related protein (PDSD5 family)